MNTVRIPKEKIDIEAMLLQGHTVQVQPKGYSMYPMLVPGRDKVMIEKADLNRLRRGDVVLYRRADGRLVLHRIWKKNKKGYYLVGDNQAMVEGPLDETSMKGKLVSFERNGRWIAADSLGYKTYYGLWLALRPLRPAISKGIHMMKKAIMRTGK